MTGKDANLKGGEQLILRSQIGELTRISPWIEHLAVLHAIPQKTQFAINLCLEKALSNIVRHGYAARPDGSIVVGYSMPESGVFLFVIEDEATPFNPTEFPAPSTPKTDELRIGGQGIHLMRHFADSLKYEATPSGNRLSIAFLSSS
jgi:anti-sigma regulatory factor (Ser/Thr protein kinase)